MRFTLNAAALSLLFAGALQAADTPVAPTAPKPYPLKTCLVSGAALGDMGDPIVKVYEGQEIKFCCGGCPKAFNKDPAKYMAELNKQAAALTPPPANAGTPAPAPAAKAGMTGMDCCK